MRNKTEKRGCFRSGLVWVARVVVVLALIAVVVFGVVFRKPLYNRFVRFPRQQKAWDSIRAKRVAPTLRYSWKEYRGVMHSHTELSHDSMVSPDEILGVLKKCDLDFIFTSDHCDNNLADYSKGWKGLHDGKLFVRGYEMNEGFMPWGLPDETILLNDADPNENARKIAEAGGVLFYAHCEEPRLWHLDELTGIEIYNIHVDAKDEDYKALIPDILFSIGKYPDQAFRLIFDRPTPFLERLDTLNKSRKIVGIGANDAHQNQGIRLIYTPEKTLLIRDTSSDEEDSIKKEFKLNAVSRLALRVLFGPLEPGKQVYRFDLDKYETSARFVNTHILARNLTEKDLIEALRAGRVFVAFDAIADARGFVWMTEGIQGKAAIGESIPFGSTVKLRAAAPNECRFTVIQDGKQVAQGIGFDYEFTPPGPGKYRVEAELDILGEWTPWIYSNYLELTEASTQPPAPAPSA
jgi:hypothetical protein